MDIFKKEMFEKLDQVVQQRPPSTAYPRPMYPYPYPSPYPSPYPPRFPRAMVPRGPRPMTPGLTGGGGYANNVVRPSNYRLPGNQVAPVAGPLPTAQPAIADTERLAIAASAEATEPKVEHPKSDPAQMAYPHEYWQAWMYGADPAALCGYDESYQGTYSYGDPNFQ